ncbi:MAG: hypothetical protein JXB62_11855 [Pirellulales bacterium]|nr:hypothetical protein [Pirellulales bacterium]
MSSTMVSFGLGILVVLQSAATGSGTPELADAKAAPAVAAAARDRDEDVRRPRPGRPSRAILPQTHAENRPSFVIRRAPQSVSEAWTRAEDARPRRAAAPRAPAGRRETIIIRLAHVPASDTAKTIQQWLALEQGATGRPAATVVGVAITNSLVVSGPTDQLKILRDVVRELDRPSPQIRIKAMLVDLALPDAKPLPAGAARVAQGDFGEMLAELKKHGELRVLAQPELLVADNQPAHLQLGGRVPRITGAQESARGRVNQVSLENVGTILGVTGRVTENDRVMLEIDLERSHLGPEEEGTPLVSPKDDPVVRASEVKTLTLQTTVSLRSGRTVLLGGMVYQSQQRCGEVLLLLQPEIVR